MSCVRGAGVTVELVRVLRVMAEDPARVRGLRRAALAFVKAEGDEQARAGLLQVAAELEKIGDFNVLRYNEEGGDSQSGSNGTGKRIKS